MLRMLFIVHCMAGLLFSSASYAASADIARELHVVLNTADRETIPNQMSLQMIQVRPEYRAKEQDIKRIILEILDSKEYENIRVEYFLKAFDEQQLKEQLALARTPAFRLYQRKMMEMIQFSGVALMRLAQAKFSQLDNPTRNTDPKIAGGNRTTFYSEDYGNFYISSWLYFDQVTERLYRLNFSNKIQGSGYSLFLFCAAKKFAFTRGFDALTISADPEDEQRGMIGFLKKGESAEAMLGARFTKSQIIEIDNKNISEMCAKGEEQAKARSPQIPRN